MKLSLSEISAATMILFAVIDILGSIPIILQIKRQVGNIKPIRTTLVSAGIMLVMLVLGQKIIKFIGIDINSFAVAGSFVLLFLALEMILGVRLFHEDELTPGSASVVPLAFPVIAGAGSITSILSIRALYETVNIVIAIVLNMILVYLVLRNSYRIEKLLGKGGLLVLKKIFGIILLAIAVKLFSQNASLLFSHKP